VPAPEPLRISADAIDTSVAFRGRIGVNGVTPPASTTTITQTYATTATTVAAVTGSDPPAGGTGATAGAYDTAANRDAMIASLTAARADILDIKKNLNAVIDILQAAGLAG
jgi:hypothetical protein